MITFPVSFKELDYNSFTTAFKENNMGFTVEIREFSPYAEMELPIATKERLGAVRVGNNLLINEEGVLRVDTADSAEGDNTRPITSAAVFAEVGNINALLETI